MRGLNKIVFINSASIKYAEVNLNGNVHFIGTQGVGKTALLRSILFFYNSDKLKLGIPKEKKNFDQYYFPYPNSYIVYEVMKESGAFSILAFKPEGRVAFRFLDSAYDKKFFISTDGLAFESWDKIREVLGKDIHYTRTINNYGEYRNILYGNNIGLPEFRKYLIFESKQFQNIPITIQNVFLNSKLDAEFIKETIIKSLNEEEIKIDLITYSKHHLKDFETNLEDIKKWTDKNEKGENSMQTISNSILKIHSAIRDLEKKRTELALQLGWALNNVKIQQPKVLEDIKQEEQKRDKIKQEITDIDNAFEKKKGEIQQQIGKYKNKLEESKTKQEKYASLKIENIIERVSKKDSLEYEKRKFSDEKGILSSNYGEITQKYKILLGQLENQSEKFKTSKQAEENTIEKKFFVFKEELGKQYDLFCDETKKQYKEKLDVAKTLVEEKKTAIDENKSKRSEVQNRRFYDAEIQDCNSKINNSNLTINESKNKIQQSKDKKNIVREREELDKRKITEDIKQKIEKLEEEQKKLIYNISQINTKIESSKDSLYGWLNKEVPNWNKTIGKVIDEENVLFKLGLNPEKTDRSDLSFYGISIDLNEISKTVKTIDDYQTEKNEFENRIQIIQKNTYDMRVELKEKIDKIKKEFQSEIKKEEGIIQDNEHKINQNESIINNTKFQLNEFRNKSESEKRGLLEKIENEISNIGEEKTKAREEVTKIEKYIDDQIEAKKKEKEENIKLEQVKVNDKIDKIGLEIQENETEFENRERELRSKEQKELQDKGADTKRISEIDKQISDIDAELTFIEKKRDTVAEYQKDKRELFDKEYEFKNTKTSLEQQLGIETSTHKQEKENLHKESRSLKDDIETKNKQIGIFKEDLKRFEEFNLTEYNIDIKKTIYMFSDENKTNKHCTQLIDELNKNYTLSYGKYNNLQETINKFTGNFQEQNIFSFKTKFKEKAEYFQFAESLKEFIEEDKISEYQKRFSEKFAHIVRQIGNDTDKLRSMEGEIQKVIFDINKDFVARNFVGAIKSMELRIVKSGNKAFSIFKQIRDFNYENPYGLGEHNLFTSDDQPAKNEKAITLLKYLIKEMTAYSKEEITLSDSFELQFKVVENDNDTGWVEKLSNVGSDGTDVLVKAMVNIMLLNVFKDRATKKQKGDFILHCMMDEIGKLHPTNVKGILKFANDRNIFFINGSPITYNAIDYNYTYLLSKDTNNVTTIKRLVKNFKT